MSNFSAAMENNQDKDITIYEIERKKSTKNIFW